MICPCTSFTIIRLSFYHARVSHWGRGSTITSCYTLLPLRVPVSPWFTLSTLFSDTPNYEILFPTCSESSLPDSVPQSTAFHYLIPLSLLTLSITDDMYGYPMCPPPLNNLCSQYRTFGSLLTLTRLCLLWIVPLGVATPKQRFS